MYVVLVVLAVLMIGPLLLERLERRVPTPVRPSRTRPRGDAS